MTRRAVITGCGVICSAAEGREALYQALLEARAPCSAGVLTPLIAFDPQRYLTSRQIKMLDPLSWAAVAATHQALDQAGHPNHSCPMERCGIAVASTYATTSSQQRFYRNLEASGPRQIDPLAFRNSNPSSLMMLVAIEHGLQGVNLTISSGETSSLDGLLHCCNALERGHSATMVLLGCDSAGLELQRYFARRRLLAGAGEFVVPYGHDSAGAALGACAAALVLEPAERPSSASRPVLAEVLAVASCAGEQTRALRGAIDRVLAESGLAPAEVRFIVGAGNGDPHQDALEGRLLSDLFAGPRPPLLTSIKGTVGECLGGAGVMSMIAAVQSVDGGWLPPIPALDRTVEGLTLPAVKRRAAEIGPCVALICSLGQLGGAAVALLRL